LKVCRKIADPRAQTPAIRRSAVLIPLRRPPHFALPATSGLLLGDKRPQSQTGTACKTHRRTQSLVMKACQLSNASSGQAEDSGFPGAERVGGGRGAAPPTTIGPARTGRGLRQLRTTDSPQRVGKPVLPTPERLLELEHCHRQDVPLSLRPGVEVDVLELEHHVEFAALRIGIKHRLLHWTTRRFTTLSSPGGRPAKTSRCIS
jgi:hypothetical protein